MKKVACVMGSGYLVMQQISGVPKLRTVGSYLRVGPAEDTSLPPVNLSCAVFGGVPSSVVFLGFPSLD